MLRLIDQVTRGITRVRLLPRFGSVFDRLRALLLPALRRICSGSCDTLLLPALCDISGRSSDADQLLGRCPFGELLHLALHVVDGVGPIASELAARERLHAARLLL